MDTKDKIQLIRNIELFRGLSENEINTIAEKAEEVNYAKGDILFAENTSRTFIFLIFSGKVELYKTTVFGEEQIITYFGKLDFLGEGSLMEDSPHSTSARAVEDTVALTLSREAFKSSGAIALAISSNITRVVSRRMRYANAKAMNITSQYESGKTR
ncbi:MAG TPA: cyclic nucleotide-binding domain-containing protein, partial [Bacteroidales bacterium]|nr:cyclic nucleotide-binding domain-containing protein [Bacteroidales bacterium]